MKQSIIFLLVIMMGCSAQKSELLGKWKYTNEQGVYAEIWLNEDQIVLIDADFFTVTLADYKIEDDTILLYYGEELQSKIPFKIISDGKFKINQGSEVEVSRFETNVQNTFDYSESTLSKIQQEFASRITE